MAIVVYDIPPIPPDPQHTHYLDAGAVKLGLEYRTLDDEELDTQYADDPESREKLEKVKPEELQDQGVSIHVVGSDDDHEYIRFDVFDNGPHYHYIRKGVVENKIVDFDPVAMGEMLPWALSQLREKLPVMLRHAGGDEVAGRLDANLLSTRVEELAALAERALRAQREAR